MQRSTITGQRLLAAFLLGFLALNYPLATLVDGSGTWFGIPGRVAYLFVAWAALIGLMAWIVESRGESR